MSASGSAAQGDFGPSATWPVLRLRAELLRRVREFFDSAGFLEVETPLASADSVIDRYLEPPMVALLAAGPGQPAPVMYLQTSPEFHMKRLLASGAGAPGRANATGGADATGGPGAIYQITRAFRLGELGPLHNPEFTMLEWYCQGDDMARCMQRISDLAELLFGRGPSERLSYAEAFERYVAVDPHRAANATLREAAERRGLQVPASLAAEDRDGWLDLLLVECVQPRLGQQQPTILYDYPASQAALAQVRTDADSPAVAERCELYVDGIELANGYHELLDATVLCARQTLANAQRAADGKPRLPEENRLLQAMQHGLPPCSGVALGVDRAVMIAAGAKSLREVMAFPIERA